MTYSVAITNNTLLNGQTGLNTDPQLLFTYSVQNLAASC